jgi:hypothetical protein
METEAAFKPWIRPWVDERLPEAYVTAAGCTWIWGGQKAVNDLVSGALSRVEINLELGRACSWQSASERLPAAQLNGGLAETMPSLPKCTK